MLLKLDSIETYILVLDALRVGLLKSVDTAQTLISVV